MALLIADIQHSGKPDRSDMGAGADLDGDGRVEIWEQEAALTPHYVSGACRELIGTPHSVCILTRGWYSARHDEANHIAKRHKGPVLYAACHLNAGGGNYGLFGFDARSSGGRRAATLLASGFESRFQITGRIEAASPSNFTGMFNTIKGIWEGPSNISGVCLEPFFVDFHADLLRKPETLADFGAVLGQALIRWAE